MIKHLRQNPEKPTCGAVCLRMIFQHRKIKGSIKNIYENISDVGICGFRECKNILILKYLLNLGFQACVVSVTNLEKVLDACSKNNINVIFNQRVNLELSCGHYVLYLKRDNNFVYVNDPLKKFGGAPIKISKLKKLLTPEGCFDIPEENTLILVNTYKKKLDMIDCVCRNGDEEAVNVRYFECVSSYVKKIVCPTHNHFIYV